jgi:phage terminase large subunit-like protein
MAFADVLDRVVTSYGKGPTDPRLLWRMNLARDDQILPGGDWRVCFFRGGRGSGKTRAGAQGLAEWILSDADGEGEYGVIAPTYADAWTKCIEGESGLLRALGTSMAEVKDHRSKTVKNAWRTYGQVVLHNGIVVYADSAAEGGLRIQGRNLKGAWCDEVGLWEKWEIAWNESLRYAVRMGVSKIIATGTPKASRPARRLVRALLRNDPGEGGVVTRRLRTIDNADNLSDGFLRAVIGASQGTRLERQELEGELLDDVANALWTRDLLDEVRCGGVGSPDGPEYLREITIGVDPSDGSETSDEQAYTVVGPGPVEDGHLYVLENWGGQEAPVPFAQRVIRRAMFLAADYGCPATLVIEKNHGGAWLQATFEQVMKQMKSRVPYRVIHASQAKRVRAEPVSALYQRHGGLVRHCHIIRKDPHGHPVPDTHMPELEDQMATFTGAQGERSPDRLDSLVWALTPYLRKNLGPPGKSGPRKWAAQKELDEMGPSASAALGRRLRGAHGGAYAASDQWDMDSFAPRNDDAERERTGPRGNVKTWR